MKKWLFPILLTLLNFYILYGQEGSGNNIENEAVFHSEKWDSHFTTHITPDQGLSYFMEHLADDVHVHLPVEGGWDQGLPYLFSFDGASYKWTNHYYDDVKINNPLIPGDAMYHFSAGDHNIRVDRYNNSIHLNRGLDSSSQISLSALAGNIGGRVGWADWFINNISGHNSAQQRAIREIDERMHLPYLFNLHYSKAKNVHLSDFMIRFTGGKKRNLDQDFMGNADAYDESFYQASLAGSIAKKYHYLAEWQHRTHAFSEFQYAEPESAQRHAVNLSFYLKEEQAYGIHMNIMDQTYRQLNFTRNVIDQDGEGLYPFYQDGLQLAFTPFYHGKGFLSDDPKWKYQLELYNSWIRHQPGTESRSNAIYIQSTDQAYQSLQVIDWEMAGHSNWLFNNKASLTYEDKNEKSTFFVKAGLHFIGFTYDQSSLLHLMPEVDIGINHSLTEKLGIGLRAGVIPRPYDVEQVRFVSAEHMNQSVYYWNDKNFNKQVDHSERGNLMVETGSRNRTISENASPARTIFIDVPIRFRASRHWKFLLNPQFRSHRHTWDVQYHPDFMIPVEQNDAGLWVYNENRQAHYEVIPYSKEWMRDSEGNLRSFLFNQPFYAGLTFQFNYGSDKWVFRGSAIAHMVVGGSSMGNGPLHNNINQPPGLLADLNIRYNNLGRLDSDRSYLANFLLAYKYSGESNLGLQLRYRDGQSFGYYETHLHENADGVQAVFTQPLPRGDDPFTGLMGRREDFLLNMSASWQHRFQYNNGYLHAGLQIYNLLDFATETSEYVYGINGDFPRAPLELQIPRTIRISLRYQW